MSKKPKDGGRIATGGKAGKAPPPRLDQVRPPAPTSGMEARTEQGPDPKDDTDESE